MLKIIQGSNRAAYYSKDNVTFLSHRPVLNHLLCFLEQRVNNISSK